MTNLVNLTPHCVNIVTETGTIDVPVSGTIARCSQSNVQVGNVNGIPVTRQSFGEILDLPASQEGVVFIVSRLVAAAAPERDDLVIPGPLVRNEKGQPIGCQGLSVI